MCWQIVRPREYVVNFTLQQSSPPELSPPLLTLDNVFFRYNERAPWLFKDVSFGIDMDTRAAIVGPNGVGKSTLLNLVMGDLVPTST